MYVSRRQVSMFVVGIVVVLSALLVILRPWGTKGRGGTIKIGADITLTGEYAYFGQQFQKGLQLAEAQANREKGGAPVTILFQDNRHDVATAVTIFERFAALDNVCAVLSLYSPVSQAVKQNAAKSMVPLVTTYTTAKDITNKWTFRDFPRMEDQVPPLVEYAAKELKLRRVGCIIFQADFAMDGRDIFRDRFQKGGGEIVRVEELPLKGTETKIRDVVARVLADKPDGVYVLMSGRPLGLTVKSLRELGFSGPILGIVMFDSPEVWDVAGPTGDRVYFSGIPFEIKGNVAGGTFAREFQARFDVEPDYMAVYGYTIGEYVIRIARECGGDRERIRDSLGKLDTASIRGRIRVVPPGDISSPVAVFRRVAGKNELVKKSPN